MSLLLGQKQRKRSGERLFTRKMKVDRYGVGKSRLKTTYSYQKLRNFKKKIFFFDTVILDGLLSNFISAGKKYFIEKSLYSWAYFFRALTNKRFDSCFKYMKLISVSNVEVRSQNVRQKDVFVPKGVDLGRSTYLWNRVFVLQVRNRFYEKSFLTNSFFEFYSFYTDRARNKLYCYLETTQDKSREWKVYTHFKWRRV